MKKLSNADSQNLMEELLRCADMCKYFIHYQITVLFNQQQQKASVSVAPPALNSSLTKDVKSTLNLMFKQIFY